MSHVFREFRSMLSPSESVHHTTSPPHDHDLNPIAERTIGLISDMATAIRIHSGASPRMWPWIVAYAVDWHNSTVSSSVGSSMADVNVSPHQRFTGRPPRVMDLAAFGCMAVVLKPPTHQHKTSLSGRGWAGAFLGRSRDSKGSYDVFVDGRVVTSSSVSVNEEYFPWLPQADRYRPLTLKPHSPAPAERGHLLEEAPSAASNVSAPATFSAVSGLILLNLFSGPYSRSNGLARKLTNLGWAEVVQVDNDGEQGGGWAHDLLNDELFAKLLAMARAGRFAALMIAFLAALSPLLDSSTRATTTGGTPDRRSFVILIIPTAFRTSSSTRNTHLS